MYERMPGGPGGEDCEGKESIEDSDSQRALRWSRLMLTSGQVSRQELNSLVMEYLMVHGYQDAVAEFSKETGLLQDHSKGVGAMAEREAARGMLIKGDIMGCIEVLNEVDASILEKDTDLLFELYKQHFVELVLSGRTQSNNIPEVGEEDEFQRVTAAIQFAQENILPLVLKDPALLKSVEQMMSLIAFSSPDNLALIISMSSPPRSRDSPDSVTAETSMSTLPAHLFFLRDAVDIQRRFDLASRVNQAILLSSGLSPEPQLPGVLRRMVYLQHKRISKLGTNAKPDFPTISNVGKISI